MVNHLDDRDRLDELGDAMNRPREAARARRADLRLVAHGDPAVAPVLPEKDAGRNAEEAPPSASAGQDPLDLYPRPDSNRRYRLERAAC
jgi:hypothetical protein